jgi:hypothetical protein
LQKMWDSGVITADAYFSEEGSEWTPVLVLFEPAHDESLNEISDINEAEGEPLFGDAKNTVNVWTDGSKTASVVPAFGFQRLIALLTDCGIVTAFIAAAYRLLEAAGIESEAVLTSVGIIILVVIFSARDVIGLGRYISRSAIVDEKTGARIDKRRSLLRGIAQLVALPSPMFFGLAVGWPLHFIVGDGVATIAGGAAGSVVFAHLIRQMASANGQAAWDHVAHSMVARSRYQQAIQNLL